ncbi:MAG: 4-hydroxy-3-methylbut-2-enyl diphosphate reductase [Planctomycetes bacterium]|nr:4-hydroxy-3-methylbut-2-enyl diphosphate reductase [Planctomycetota bacterium]
MNVLVAQYSGFCDGVKRAIRLAQDGAAEFGPLYSDGPLVHNLHATKMLEHRQIVVSDPERANGSALIRAHGIPPDQRERWLREGWRLVDATCPKVTRNQNLAGKAAAAGKHIILAGDPDHAEVAAVAGSAGGSCVVISTENEAAAWQRPDGVEHLLLLAQTTFGADLFEKISAILLQRFPRLEIHNTICSSTHIRQEEARQLAAAADALVVVGGKESANTRRLAEAGGSCGKPVFLVESRDEIDVDALSRFQTVAVTAGASTPEWITEGVIEALKLIDPVGKR